MDTLEERVLIYTALIMLCAALGSLVGAEAGFWSFVQIAAVIELTYWFAYRIVRGGIGPW